MGCVLLWSAADVSMAHVTECDGMCLLTCCAVVLCCEADMSLTLVTATTCLLTCQITQFPTLLAKDLMQVLADVAPAAGGVDASDLA